jgi:hypothetical protein
MNIDARILIKQQESEFIHTLEINHHDQVGFISGMQEWLNTCNPVNGLHHMNQVKVKNHLIISINSKNAFDKIHHQFMIISFQ